jgi:hypothetical protein
MRRVLLMAALVLIAGPAAADHERYADAPLPNQGGDGPGGLSTHDVMGKRLLDANGVDLGGITSVTPDGGTAWVQPQNGKKFSVDMRKLSLGNGPNTVIESGHSDADKLNRMEMGR